jgi:hypothetical protein
MSKWILMAVLAAGTTYVARQNHFDKTEMSSEAIYVSVGACAAKHGGPSQQNIARWWN